MRLKLAASGFDILAAADELRDAGFDENQTRAINDIHRTAREELAIKSDIDTLKAERTAPRAEVRADPCRALWGPGRRDHRHTDRAAIRVHRVTIE